MRKKIRIVFMGTPRFAVAPLKALLNAGYPVVAVTTSPDKPAGRGRKLQQSEIKVFAESAGLKLLQPANLKDRGFIDELKSLKADLYVVVAFRMLPEQVWSIPPNGTINLHASLLPQYRGASPINHVIINGEKTTGITTFFINHEIDTGQIILQEKVDIPETFTAGDLHDSLMHAGAGLVVKTIEQIESGEIQTISQKDLIKPGEILKPAPKIHKEDCRINWNINAINIYNFIRGLSPSPAAYSWLSIPPEEINIRIFKANYKLLAHDYPSGSIIAEGRKTFGITVPDGLIYPLLLQQAGKRIMDVQNFMNGMPELEKYSFS